MARVDLPEPEVPMTARVSPCRTLRSRSAHHRFGGQVAEGDVVELDVQRLVRQLLGVRLVGDVGLGVDDLEHAHGAGAHLLAEGDQGGEGAHRADEGGEVAGEGEEGADGDLAVQGHVAAEGEDADLADGGDRAERRVVPRGQPHRAQPRAEQRGGGPVELVDLLRLLAEALDHAYAGDGGLDDAGERARLLLGVPGGGEQPAAGEDVDARAVRGRRPGPPGSARARGRASRRSS